MIGVTHAPSPPTVRLKTCVRCDRFARGSTHGARLAGGIAAALEPALGGRIMLRQVPCLAGCKRPANIELSAPDRVAVRLDGLEEGDADAVARLARLYADTRDGVVPAHQWPAELLGRVAAQIAPRNAGAGVGRMRGAPRIGRD